MFHPVPDFSKDALKTKMQAVYKGSRAGDVAASKDGSDGRLDRQAGLTAADDTIEGAVGENTDTEAKEKIKARNDEYRRRVRAYFDKKMPQERKDQIASRLKKMVLECQNHPDYAEAIRTLLNLVEEYGGYSRVLARGGTDTLREARTGLNAAEADLKTALLPTTSGLPWAPSTTMPTETRN